MDVYTWTNMHMYTYMCVFPIYHLTYAMLYICVYTYTHQLFIILYLEFPTSQRISLL